jgi:hypothetical protein
LEAILDGREPPTWIEPAVGEAPPPAHDAPMTASGLVRRVPRASGIVEPGAATEPRVRRSPDEVRAMLSRYRSGLRAGRGTSNPSSEE